MSDLDPLRAFRRDLAAPAPGVEDRIVESVWQQVLQAERAAGRSRRRWALVFARRVIGAAAAVSIAAAFSLLGNEPAPTGNTAFRTQSAAAGLLNSTALNLVAPSSGDDGFAGGAEANMVSVSSGSYGTPSSPAGVVAATGVEAGASSVPEPEPTAEIDGALIAQGPAGLDAAGMMQAIPADPRVLRDVLRSATAGEHAADADYGPLRVAAGYLADPQAPAAVRATFFRMLATVEGLDASGTAVDVLGRPGVVIARLDAGSGVRQQLLVDARTALLLELREFTTRDAGGECPPGSTVTLEVFEGGFVVTPEAAPYANWPAVRDACAP